MTDISYGFTTKEIEVAVQGFKDGFFDKDLKNNLESALVFGIIRALNAYRNIAAKEDK